jgi:branched-chain amino acid aminotransferase
MEDLVSYFDGTCMKTSEILIPVESLGFTRGYGAYECFRSYRGKAFRLEDHLQRLKNTCKSLLIPYPKEDLTKVVDQLLAINGEDEIVFRLYVTCVPDESLYQIVILSNTLDAFAVSNPTTPLSVKTVVDDREHRGIKSTGYGFTEVSTKRAKALGFDTILLIGEDQSIHELGKANFFAVKGTTLITPNEYFLPGITRKTILEIAQSFGYSCVEGKITIDDLKEVDEVFSSATIRGIVPIKQIDDRHFFDYRHAEKLQSYFHNLSAKITV